MIYSSLRAAGWSMSTWATRVILALISLRRSVHPVIFERCEPSVSVLIAARNEEKDIRWKINETLGWDYPPEKLDVWWPRTHLTIRPTKSSNR